MIENLKVRQNFIRKSRMIQNGLTPGCGAALHEPNIFTQTWKKQELLGCSPNMWGSLKIPKKTVCCFVH
jgi:hypothetical protein